MGVLDAVLDVVAPGLSARRAVARAGRQILNYGRHGASYQKASLRGWSAPADGPERDIADHLDTLRGRSRDLTMGGGLPRGALDTIRANEVGAGLRLNATVDADHLGIKAEQARAFEDAVEREWALWSRARYCDAERRLSFGALQSLARYSWLSSGDVFALLDATDREGRYNLRVRLVEADRVKNPLVVPPGRDIVSGIECDANGAPVAIHVAKQHPGDSIRLSNIADLVTSTRIPFFGAETGEPVVLHLLDLERPGQRRGVPVLAPVVNDLKQLTRYTEAEIIAAVVSGFLAVTITSEAPDAVIGGALPPPGSNAPATEQTVSSAERIKQLSPGMFAGLAPGEKLEGFNPGRPNAGFGPFVEAVLKQIGAGLGVPFELLLMQFNSSYSASRAAFNVAARRFRVGRTRLAEGLCQPVYEAFVAELVARGRVEAPGFFDDELVRAAWCGAEWIGPPEVQIDPVNEIKAAKLRIDEGLSTRQREARELNGTDFYDNHPQRVREEELRVDGHLVAPIAAPAEQSAPDGERKEAA